MTSLYNYEVYTMAGELLGSFNSNWKYSEDEQIFLHNQQKINLIINHITHDVFIDDNRHVVRLYCQERKVVYGR